MTAQMRLAVTIALVSAWLGAALLVAASVAPAAFDVLPSRALAGDVVGRVLPVVLVSGILIGVFIAGLTARASRARYAFAAIISVACAAAYLVVGPRIARLRDELGPAIDTLSLDDVRRIAFVRLHMFSVGLLGVAMLAAVALLVLSLLALRRRAAEPSNG